MIKIRQTKYDLTAKGLLFFLRIQAASFAAGMLEKVRSEVF